MAFSHAFFIKRVYPNDKQTVSYNEISLELLCWLNDSYIIVVYSIISNDKPWRLEST